MDKPIVFEVFTDSEDESNALQSLRNLIISPKQKRVKKILSVTKKVLGEKLYYTLAREVSEL